MGGETVAYHLRPNKAIERALFIDLLARVGRRFNISDYTYYGFGGPFMEDFRAFHAALRIEKMHSVERDAVVQARQRFNTPFSGVTYELAGSSEFLTRFSPDNSSVVWLDFASPGELKQQLDDVRVLVSKLASGDVFKVTLNARVESLLENNTLDQEQLKLLRKNEYERRANDYLPINVDPSDLRPDRYPKLLLRSVRLAVDKGIFSSGGLTAQPLTAFTYADGPHLMLTATGIVLEPDQVLPFFEATRIETWGFAETAWAKAQSITAPVLSTKERLLLESMVPKANIPDIMSALGGLVGAKGIAIEDVKAFVRFYRIYPQYSRVSY